MPEFSQLPRINQGQIDYGLTIAGALHFSNEVALWCEACEGVVIDISINSHDLNLSSELHAIQHAWFEYFNPQSLVDARATFWSFYQSLGQELQMHECLRRARLDDAPATMDEIGWLI